MAPDTLGENSAKALPTRLPLPRQVASAIRSRIISREWEPGDQIPSEDELAKLFAVSRATVREAVSLLSVQGYLIKNGELELLLPRHKRYRVVLNR